MTIRNKEDLRAVYSELKFCEGIPVQSWRIRAKCMDLKKAIREYHKEQTAKPQQRLVKEYGIDGYDVLMELPEHLKDVETATEYFEAHEVMRCMPSMYDCTGQFFTISYKIFERHGKMWAYHQIRCDV